jgi:hypothetical protein
LAGPRIPIQLVYASARGDDSGFLRPEAHVGTSIVRFLGFCEGVGVATVIRRSSRRPSCCCRVCCVFACCVSFFYFMITSVPRSGNSLSTSSFGSSYMRVVMTLIMISIKSLVMLSYMLPPKLLCLIPCARAMKQSRTGSWIAPHPLFFLFPHIILGYCKNRC